MVRLTDEYAPSPHATHTSLGLIGHEAEHRHFHDCPAISLGVAAGFRSCAVVNKFLHDVRAA